jgi:uncharacterized Zn-finger protein
MGFARRAGMYQVASLDPPKPAIRTALDHSNAAASLVKNKSEAKGSSRLEPLARDAGSARFRSVAPQEVLLNCHPRSNRDASAMANTLPHIATAPANAQQRYEVHRADLPLSCPLPSMALWNSHPRVYLPVAQDGGEAQCPYCGAHFVLVD